MEAGRSDVTLPLPLPLPLLSARAEQIVRAPPIPPASGAREAGPLSLRRWPDANSGHSAVLHETRRDSHEGWYRLHGLRLDGGLDQVVGEIEVDAVGVGQTGRAVPGGGGLGVRPGHADAALAVPGDHRGSEAIGVRGEYGRAGSRPQPEIGAVLEIEMARLTTPTDRDQSVAIRPYRRAGSCDVVSAITGQEPEPG